MGKVKEHLCRVCGEKDSENFYAKMKGICKACSKNNQNDYYSNNRESRLGYQKDYTVKNKKSIKISKAFYYIDNREDIIEKSKLYSKENPETVKEYKRKYQEKNREALIIKKVKYNKDRLQKDPGFRYLHNLRVRQRLVLKGFLSTTKGLGLNTKDLNEYLESMFQDGMTHENYRTVWELDHKIPVSTIEVDDKGNPVDSLHNRKLIYYKNLQPLTVEDNRSKGDKILPELLEEFNRDNFFD